MSLFSMTSIKRLRKGEFCSVTSADRSRLLADIFRALPDKRSFPDYYETISEPESLDNVSVRLKQFIAYGSRN